MPTLGDDGKTELTPEAAEVFRPLNKKKGVREGSGGYHLPDKPAIDRMLCMGGQKRANCNVDAIFMTSPGWGKIAAPWYDYKTSGFSPSTHPAYKEKVFAAVRSASQAELTADPDILKNNPDFEEGGDVLVVSYGTSYQVKAAGRPPETKKGPGRVRAAGREGWLKDKARQALKAVAK
jgi:hypothetical protein